MLILLGALAAILARRMWRRGAGGRKDRPREQEEGNGIRPLPLITTAFCTGLASGFFGIGGGFLIVPALVLVAGLPMGIAVATSLLVIAINGAVGVFSYAVQGRAIDYGVAWVFVMGGLGGMWLGQKVGGGLDDRMLARVFAVALMLVAVFLFYKNLWAI